MPLDLETKRAIAEALAEGLKPLASKLAELEKRQRETDRASRQSVSDLKIEADGVHKGVSMTYENLLRHVVELDAVVRDSVLPRATGAEAAAVAGAQSALRVEGQTSGMSDDARSLSVNAYAIEAEAKRQRRMTMLTIVSMVLQALVAIAVHFLTG